MYSSEIKTMGYIRYREFGSIAECYTKTGFIFYVDIDDLPFLSAFRWSASKDKDSDKRRPVTRINGKKKYLYRLLLGVTDPKKEVDHKDGNPMNCVRSNLRITDAAGNGRNKVCWSEFGINGISRLTSGKYKVVIHKDYHQYYLGVYETLEEAIEVRIQAEKEMFGIYAPYERYVIVK